MIGFPNAKINLGLRVVEKRHDGFHNIETIFVPIGLRDIIEIIPANETTITFSGIAVDSLAEDNLCMRAFKMFQQEVGCSNVSIHLHKVIPMGAGLGGGSSDAAFTLKLLASIFSPGTSAYRLKEMASRLGSDCPFFIDNCSSLAHGRGEILQPVALTLKGMYLILVNPGLHVSTKDAYAGVTPKTPELSLLDLIKEPIDRWQDSVVNDFEDSVFRIHPAIKSIKLEMTRMGAIYAAMSGSGSSVFGIFEKPIPNLEAKFPYLMVYSQVL